MKGQLHGAIEEHSLYQNACAVSVWNSICSVMNNSECTMAVLPLVKDLTLKVDKEDPKIVFSGWFRLALLQFVLAFS